jgi:hypothetical protein
MANTDRFYTLKDVATKVLPCLCMLTVDPEKDVRDEAFKTIKMFTQKLEKVSESPELALEMEKDVSSCSLDLKNETSWTSWAMTSLSAKMTGYKNKSQQPSVALNMQPLGQTPSLTSNSSSTNQQGEKKAQGADETKNEIAAGKKSNETGNVSNLTRTEFTPTINNNNSSSNGSGWMEDNEWKDLEDDDEMEPIEPIDNNKPKPSLSTSFSATSKANNSLKDNNDWSNNDWSNSFDDDKNSNQFSYENFTSESSDLNSTNRTGGTKLQSKIGSASNISTQLPPSSSYNWNNSNANVTASPFLNDPIKNEEDLFSSLVKDINISNKVAFFETIIKT